MQLSSEQFKKFSRLAYEASGIHLHEGKLQLLQARLSKRLRATGILSVESYLNTLARDADELIHFIDAVSTNHTYFFRENHHFNCLQNQHEQIWCAASSSGEEPYSIAITCLQKGFRPAILATDISTKVLETARKGIYPDEKIRNIPAEILKKYFQKGCGRMKGHVRVKEEIRKMVSFRRFNLLTDAPPTDAFDIVFCRNVLIYFDASVKGKVVHRLHRSLKHNGYFIIGGAESLNNLDHPYQYVKPSVYRKV